jgi:hypothetical protein
MEDSDMTWANKVIPLAAGLVTALLYWFLARQPTQRNAEPTA